MLPFATAALPETYALIRVTRSAVSMRRPIIKAHAHMRSPVVVLSREKALLVDYHNTVGIASAHGVALLSTMIPFSICAICEP